MQLVIHGMHDSDISRNTNGELTELAKLVDYIHAEEVIRNEFTNLMTEDGSVSALRRSS